jgi:hypothetical protein
MATWAATITSVKDHLWRGSDVSDTLVHTHLLAAMRYIEAWQKREWYWLEDTRTTDSSDEQLTAPSDMKSPVSLAVSTDSGESYEPLAMQPIGILHMRWTTDDGVPEEYAYQNGYFHLRPAPDAEYRFKLHYKKFLPEISGVNTNVLTNLYQLALIYRACETLARGVLKDDADADRYARLFATEIEGMEDEDDDKKKDMLSGDVQPDTTFYSEPTWS